MDSFFQLQSKTKVGVHTVAGLAINTRQGRVLACDGLTFSLWELRDPSTGFRQLEPLKRVRVPSNVASVIRIHCDSDYGAYIATCIDRKGRSLTSVVDEGLEGANMEAVAGEPMHDECINDSAYNERAHQLILSLTVKRKKGKLRFFSFRHLRHVRSSSQGGGAGPHEFVLIQDRTIVPPHHDDAELSDSRNRRTQDSRIRCLALDLRTNYLVGTLGRGVVAWDAESGDVLYKIQSMAPNVLTHVALAPGSTLLAAAHEDDDGLPTVKVWQLMSDGTVTGVASCVSTPRAVSALALCDHGATPLGQPVLYVTDEERNVMVWSYHAGGGQNPAATLESVTSFKPLEEQPHATPSHKLGRKGASVACHPCLQRYQLCTLLAAGDSVYGLTYHGPRAATTHSRVDGAVMGFQVLTEIQPLAATGAAIVLTRSPNLLYMIERSTGRVLREMVLPVNDRTFQLPDKRLSALSRATPTCFRHIPSTQLTLVGWTDGRVDVMNWDTGERAHVLRSPATHVITCVCWFPVGAAIPQPPYEFKAPMCVVAGADDGSLIFWVVHTHGSTLVGTVTCAHPLSIVSVKPRYPSAAGPFVLITVSSDGEMKTWAPSSPQSLGEWHFTSYVHMGDRTITCVEGLALDVVAVGFDDGTLETWESAEGGALDHGHLHTTRRPLQCLRAHTAGVTSLVVKTATPSTRLLLSASNDCSVICFTFDGHSLHMFQRIMLTRTIHVCLDVDLPSAQSLHTDTHNPALTWRVLGTVADSPLGFLTTLRRYARPVQAIMESATSNTDSSLRSVFGSTEQTYVARPMTARFGPPFGSFTTQLCAYRFDRLRPMWLQTPDEENAREGYTRQLDGWWGATHTDALGGQGTGPAPPVWRDTGQGRHGPIAVKLPSQSTVYHLSDSSSTTVDVSRSHTQSSMEASNAQLAKAVERVVGGQRHAVPRPRQRAGMLHMRVVDMDESCALPKQQGHKGVRTRAEAMAYVYVGLFGDPAGPAGQEEAAPSEMDDELPTSSPSLSSPVLSSHEMLATQPPPPPITVTTHSISFTDHDDEDGLTSDGDNSCGEMTVSQPCSSITLTFHSREELSDGSLQRSPQRSVHDASSRPSTRQRQGSRHGKAGDRSCVMSDAATAAGDVTKAQQHINQILLNLDAHSMPSYMTDFYRESDALSRGGHASEATAPLKGAQPPVFKSELCESYRSLRRIQARRQVHIDRAVTVNSLAGVGVGLPLGHCDAEFLRALERMQRELAIEAQHMQMRNARWAQRRKGPADMAVVAMKQETGGDEVFWLDCLKTKPKRTYASPPRRSKRRTDSQSSVRQPGEVPRGLRLSIVSSGRKGSQSDDGVRSPSAVVSPTAAPGSPPSAGRVSLSALPTTVESDVDDDDDEDEEVESSEEEESRVNRRSSMASRASMGSRQSNADVAARARSPQKAAAVRSPVRPDQSKPARKAKVKSPEARSSDTPSRRRGKKRASKVDTSAGAYEQLKAEHGGVLDFEHLMAWDKLSRLLADGCLSVEEVRDMYEAVQEGQAGEPMSQEAFVAFTKLLEERMEALRAPTRITAEVVNVAWNSVVLTFTVDKPSTVWVVLHDEYVRPKLEDFTEDSGGVRGSGPVDAVKADRSYEVVFTQLSPATKYEAYFYAEHTVGRNKPPSCFEIDDVLESSVQVHTPPRPPENLFIEWEGLSKQQQDVELVAASKDRHVVAACRKSNMALPETQDILSGNVRTQSIVRRFKLWWINAMPLREDFLLREMRFALEHEPSLKEDAERDGVSLETEDAAMLSVEGLKVESEEEQGQVWRRVRRLRSWYKGGRVIEEMEGDQQAMAAARLEWRTEFLSRHSAEVDAAWAMVRDIADACAQVKREAGKPAAPARRTSRAEYLRLARIRKGEELLQERGMTLDSDFTLQDVANAYLFEPIDLGRYVVELESDPMADTLALTASLTSVFTNSTPLGSGELPLAPPGGLTYAAEAVTTIAQLDRAEVGQVVETGREAEASAAAATTTAGPETSGALVPPTPREKLSLPPPLVDEVEVLPRPPLPDDFIPFCDLPPELATLELQLATLSTDVMELAIMDAMEVPEVEDAVTEDPYRQAIWSGFVAWYADMETAYEDRWYENPDPAREDLRYMSICRQTVLDKEARLARRDTTVRSQLGWVTPRHATRSADSTNSYNTPHDVRPQRISHKDEEAEVAVHRDFRVRYFTTYHVRRRFIGDMVDRVMVSRRAHVLKALVRMDFPMTGVMFPAIPSCLDLDPRPLPYRFVVFPTLDGELYSWEEMEEWYTAQELETEDLQLQAAEVEARMLNRESLITDKEACERTIMEWEDRRSDMVRIAEDFLCDLEDEDQLRHDQAWELGLDEDELDALRYSDGTGLDNNDDRQAVPVVVMESDKEDDEEARLAEMQRRMEEEARKRHEEEIRRKEELERQERVRETEDLRRSIQAHLDDLKRKRAEDAVAAKAKLAEEQRRKALQEEEDRLAALEAEYVKQQQERREAEKLLIQSQQVLGLEKTRERRESSLMRQEDILSQQREREDKDKLSNALERLEFLRYIYTPYRRTFMDDDIETVLWPGPRSYKPRQRRKWVDPYSVPHAEHILDTPDNIYLMDEKEFDRRVLSTPDAPRRLVCRAQQRIRAAAPASPTRPSQRREEDDSGHHHARVKPHIRLRKNVTDIEQGGQHFRASSLQQAAQVKAASQTETVFSVGTEPPPFYAATFGVKGKRARLQGKGQKGKAAIPQDRS